MRGNRRNELGLEIPVNYSFVEIKELMGEK